MQQVHVVVMIERLLGNIYEQYKTPDEVAAYWIQILKTSKDGQTRVHASQRLMELLKQKKIRNLQEVYRLLQEK